MSLPAISPTLYPFDETIASLKTLASSGKKLGVFIGRRPYEELPQENDTVWVSLDSGIENHHNSPE